MDDARIRILLLGGQWETLGSDRLRGIVPTGIEASSDSWGPSEMHFQLAAEAGARRPDVLPFTPVELEIGGILVWSGFVWQRPSDQNSYSVGCRGWQFHLDDDLLDRVYVHTRMSDYIDQRTDLATPLASYTTGWNVASDRGIYLSIPNGNVVANNTYGAVYLDLGPDSTAARVAVRLKGGGKVNMKVIVRMGDSAGTGGDETSVLATTAPTTDTDYVFTPSSSHRYVRIVIGNESGGTLTGDDTSWVQVSSVKVFRTTTYDASFASTLKADTVVTDVLGFAPLLSQSTSLISAGTFSLPSYVTAGYSKPKDVMEAVNMVEFYRLKIGGETLKQLVFDPKPSAPIAEVGDWSGSQFDDATVTGEPIYNRAILDGTGPDGARLVSKRTQTGDLVTRRGFTRSARVDVSTPGTSAVFDRINDLWLAEHKTAPFSGTLWIIGSGARRVLSGGSIPPQEFLLYSGEKIRLANRVDPDAGNWGRDGRIAGSTYRHDDRAVEIAIDDQRTRFDTILARYAALVGG